LTKNKKPSGVVFILSGLIIVLFWLSLPSTLFKDPSSTVVFDRNNNLLGARIANDGQWRFPENDVVPEKFSQCITTFEDRYFFSHPGVNLFALFRAFRQNIQAGKIVSGGSTITMQTIRLSRKGKARTVWEKVIEMWLALRLEVAYSKSEILSLYSSHAPFGGNVVGLDAAAWRYFGRAPTNLSWAETATLAVLPNAPALIHPGRNRDALEQKRNRLLAKLLQEAIIDSLTFEISLEESLPLNPLPLPNFAPQLTDRMGIENPEKVTQTTIDIHLQNQVGEIVQRHHELLKSNQIFNAAVMVLDVESNETLVYVGNTAGDGSGNHGNDVDVITKPRSSGSILKPLLYCAMLDEGELLPGTLVADIPTTISNYSPKNFNVTYDGAVPAKDALIRSLNVPAVRLLSEFGQQRFYHKLKDSGFSTLNFDAEHYGLSLILGGAEVMLWDLCKVYRGLAQTLNEYDSNPEEAAFNRFPGPKLRVNEVDIDLNDEPVFGAGAIFTTLEAMKEVRRPDAEAGWESFLSSRHIAWKTGTSFGFRDAWAMGVTPQYVVGVWVGNADGEGRPGLTGLTAAAPILFDVFDILPAGRWFVPPWDELVELPVCQKSGMRPSQFCPELDTILVLAKGLETSACKYHQLVHLDSSEKNRVHAGCYPQNQIHSKPWFVLPPAMAWFYRSVDPFYRSLPPWLSTCNIANESPMQLIWPDKPSKIYIPREMNGTLGKVVFEVAHQSPDQLVYWYVDDQFQGTTQHLHKMALQPENGKHQLVLMDEDGNILGERFEIVGR
jgi:penicillin-binding protein 1C